MQCGNDALRFFILWNRCPDSSFPSTKDSVFFCFRTPAWVPAVFLAFNSIQKRSPCLKKPLGGSLALLRCLRGGRSAFTGQGLRHAAKKQSLFVPSFIAFSRLLNCDAIAVLDIVYVSRQKVSPPGIHQQRGSALARSGNPEV